MEVKRTVGDGASVVWRWVRPCLVGVCLGLGVVGLWFLLAAEYPGVPGPSRLTTSLWALLGSGVALLGLSVAFLSSRVMRVACVAGLGLMIVATAQAWHIATSMLTWAGPDPMVAMGFACLLGVGVVLLVVVMIPVAEEERLRGRVVVLPVAAGVVLAVAGAGFGVQKVAADLSPVLSITAEAPAQVPGMPGRLPGDTVKGELVATFTSPELSAGTYVKTGARGPILRDQDTVIGVDGETGKQLWKYQLQNQATSSPLEGRIRSLVVSPDGTAVALKICPRAPFEGVATVLDGLTGKVRFVFPLRCFRDEFLSVTDHVVVTGQIAYDIHTGERRWKAKKSQEFLPGTNSSSRLVVELDNSALHEWDSGCFSCTGRPLDVVSDQDPTKVLFQLDRVVRDPCSDYPGLYQGWTVVHELSDESNRWVNIGTLETRQAPAGDPSMRIANGSTDIPSLYVSSRDESALWIHHALDPWSGQVWEVTTAPKEDADLLGENMWMPYDKDGVKELAFIRGDGEPLAPPIPLAAPEGKPYGSGAWEARGSIRTRDGGATLLRWASKSQERAPVLLVLYR